MSNLEVLAGLEETEHAFPELGDRNSEADVLGVSVRLQPEQIQEGVGACGWSAARNRGGGGQDWETEHDDSRSGGEERGRERDKEMA